MPSRLISKKKRQTTKLVIKRTNKRKKQVGWSNKNIINIINRGQPPSKRGQTQEEDYQYGNTTDYYSQQQPKVLARTIVPVPSVLPRHSTYAPTVTGTPSYPTTYPEIEGFTFDKSKGMYVPKIAPTVAPTVAPTTSAAQPTIPPPSVYPPSAPPSVSSVPHPPVLPQPNLSTPLRQVTFQSPRTPKQSIHSDQTLAQESLTCHDCNRTFGNAGAKATHEQKSKEHKENVERNAQQHNQLFPMAPVAPAATVSLPGEPKKQEEQTISTQPRFAGVTEPSQTPIVVDAGVQFLSAQPAETGHPAQNAGLLSRLLGYGKSSAVPSVASTHDISPPEPSASGPSVPPPPPQPSPKRQTRPVPKKGKKKIGARTRKQMESIGVHLPPEEDEDADPDAEGDDD